MERIDDLAEARRARIRERIFLHIRETSDKDKLVSDAALLYWKTTLPVSFIADALSITEAQLRKMTKGHGGQYICANCKCETPAASRAEYHSHMKNNESFTCKKCEDAKRKELSAKWKEENRIREEFTAKRQNELSRMPYKDYLKSPEWQETRLKKLKSAGYKCQLCNSASVLDVHHRVYGIRGAEFMKDLIVLCRACHAKHHGKEE